MPLLTKAKQRTVISALRDSNVRVLSKIIMSLQSYGVTKNG